MPADIAIDMQTGLYSTKDNVHKSGLEIATHSSTKTRGITALTVSVGQTRKNKHGDRLQSPPRWKSLEFIFYYIVALVVIPYMALVPINLSSPMNPNYRLFERKLSPGWLFGRPVDNSDRQYRAFRNNVPALSLLALVYLILQTLYTRFAARSPPRDNTHLVPFIIAFSILYLIGLHGTSTIKIFITLTVNYFIGKGLGGSFTNPIITWIFNIIILFENERNEGYRFASLHSSMATLDALEGLYPRWHISFNITMLRLMSFNMDYYLACNSPSAATVESMSDKERTTTSHSPELYTYANYIAYVLFPPLYIAGPIITFNNFFWQLRKPEAISCTSVLHYLKRFSISFMMMELILHFMYVVSIKDTKAWLNSTPLQLSMIGFWNLIIVWLKLLLPWRFFRLWSLASGMDPPENMVRCMANNYSTTGFWRSWHRSYNLWIVRYIYIPLGGARNIALTALLIFTFVALWHDLSLRLLTWGWLVSLFILPELLAARLLPQTKYGHHVWYRHVCALGAVLNILFMMTANLIGFVIGSDGMLYMVRQIGGSMQGFGFLFASCCCLFIGAQLMFEYREEEKRRGIFLRC